MFYLNQKQGRLFPLLLFFIFISCFVKAQTNLVPNSSFEQYTTCPQGYLHEHPDDWYQPDKGGGGYYNACRIPYGGVPNTGYGFQYARTGVAMIALGFWNGNQNAYFQVKLTDSLRKGKSYYIEFYTVPTKSYYKLACNNISLLLTSQAVYADTANNIKIIPANPQVVSFGNPIIKDTTEWTKIGTIYKALGSEQYITLGNFKYTNQTDYIIKNPNGSYFGAVYFIDDVSVIPLDNFCLKADAGRDTTTNVGDSVFIGSLTNGIDSIKWYANGTTLIDSIRPGFWLHPATAGSYMYVLQQTVNGCFSKDTVYVNVVLPLQFIKYEVRSTNEKQVENKWTTSNEINVSHFYVQRSGNGKDFTTIHKEQAKNQALNNYTYTDELTTNYPVPTTLYYRIVSVDKDGKTNFSEVRELIIHHSSLNTIAVYPNPAHDVVNIECKEGIKEVKIFNSVGQQIARFVRNDGTNQHYQFSIAHYQLPKGLYIVQVINKNGIMKNEKLLVE